MMTHNLSNVYTVKALADLSGVTVRTLHYYDQIGLLSPDHVGDNGYRYYDRAGILRLQQVLFYRQLGLPLMEIKKVLDAPDFDIAAALQHHRTRLAEELVRYSDLIKTIDTTLKTLDGEHDMSARNPFQGFPPEKQKAYENEIIERYGDSGRAKIIQSKARTSKLSETEMRAVQDEGHQINLQLVDLIEQGQAEESDAVQAIVAKHHAWVSHFWTPDQEAYIGLGELYLDHADFRAFYDKYDARLVQFLANAMRIYAETHLD